jgi:uncharacterized membrane protein YphA (DoxX/SURF4 family)
MGAIALAARVVLAIAFAIAAVEKLRGLTRVREQMSELLGARVGRIATIATPIVELLLAVALVIARSSAVPGILAALVLLAFTAVLVRAEARHVPCPCFGGGAPERPVGPLSILRNGVLLALAVLATGDANGASLPAALLASAIFAVVTYAAVRAAR